MLITRRYWDRFALTHVHLSDLHDSPSWFRIFWQKKKKFFFGEKRTGAVPLSARGRARDCAGAPEAGHRTAQAVQPATSATTTTSTTPAHVMDGDAGRSAARCHGPARGANLGGTRAAVLDGDPDGPPCVSGPGSVALGARRRPGGQRQPRPGHSHPTPGPALGPQQPCAAQPARDGLAPPFFYGSHFVSAAAASPPTGRPAPRSVLGHHHDRGARPAGRYRREWCTAALSGA